MHQRQRRNGALVLQVEVIHADLVGQQQALVVDRTGREGRHVEFLAVLELERLDVVGGTTANDVQLALERIGHEDIGTTTDEYLADHRLLGLDGRGHRHVVIDRHITPAKQNLTFVLDRTLDFLYAGMARSCFLRQEDHADAVLAIRRQFDALPGHLFAIELVRNLDQDAGTVTLQRVGANGAAVIQILQDQQTLLDDAMILLAFDMGDKTHAASVVLVGRVVQTLPLRYSRFHHTRSLKILGR